MTRQEKIAVTAALGKLTLLLGLEAVSADRLKAYLQLLDDLPATSVLMAIETYGRTATYSKFPLPGELRELAQGSATDAAARAWIQLQNAYRKAGASMSVLFEDGAIGAAMQDTFGGWVACCEAFHPVYAETNVSPSYIEETEVDGKKRLTKNPTYLSRERPVGSFKQIGGLTLEMLRARQKDFEVAYRRAQREGKTAPAYYPGECEIDNRRTVSTWSKGLPVELADGRQVLVQRIHVQGDEGRTVEAHFDFHTATLVTPIPELISKPAVRALPPRREQKLIGDGAPMMDPEEGKKLVNAYISGLLDTTRMPSERPAMSPKEWTARAEQLKQQATQMNPEGTGDAMTMLKEQFIKQQGPYLVETPSSDPVQRSATPPEEPFPE